MSEEYEGANRRRWHIKKEISLGDLVAIVSAALAVVYAYTTLDKRVTLLESAAVVQKVTDTKQDEEALRYQARLERAIEEINKKLDRLIEGRR